MTRSTLALIAVLLGGSANAQIVINASNYPFGTDISSAIPGVSLSFITLSSAGPSHGTSLSTVSYSKIPLTVESSGLEFPVTYSTLGGGTGGDAFQKLILVQFAQPINYFSFVSFDEDGDANVAYLFNSSGFDIANPYFFGGGCVASNPTGHCLQWNVGGSYQSSAPISTMMIGSTSEAADILSINATLAAPEIDSSSAASALMLLVGGLLLLRDRRLARPVA